MTTDAEKLCDSIALMLRRRALRGNPQSAHGIDAGYEWEVCNFVDTLDRWISRSVFIRSETERVRNRKKL